MPDNWEWRRMPPDATNQFALVGIGNLAAEVRWCEKKAEISSTGALLPDGTRLMGNKQFRTNETDRTGQEKKKKDLFIYPIPTVQRVVRREELP